MAPSEAVQQAAALLRGRLDEARQRRDELSAEIATIEEALTSLRPFTEAGQYSTPAGVVDALADGGQQPAKSVSVRAAVKEILDSEDRGFTPAEIRARIPAEVMNGKTAKQRTNSVRTALWSLRQSKEAALIDETRTKSTRWPTPDPEPPAPGDDAEAD